MCVSTQFPGLFNYPSRTKFDELSALLDSSRFPLSTLSRGPPHKPIARTENPCLRYGLKTEIFVKANVYCLIRLEIASCSVRVGALAPFSDELAADSLTLKMSIDAKRTQVPVFLLRIAQTPCDKPSKRS